MLSNDDVPDNNNTTHRRPATPPRARRDSAYLLSERSDLRPPTRSLTVTDRQLSSNTETKVMTGGREQLPVSTPLCFHVGHMTAGHACLAKKKGYFHLFSKQHGVKRRTLRDATCLHVPEKLSLKKSLRSEFKSGFYSEKPRSARPSLPGRKKCYAC